MIVLMVFAAVVSVAQLTILGSGSRTLRLGTLLQAVGVGFLVCAPVTVCLQWLLTRGVALAPTPTSAVSSTWPRGPTTRSSKR